MVVRIEIQHQARMWCCYKPLDSDTIGGRDGSQFFVRPTGFVVTVLVLRLIRWRGAASLKKSVIRLWKYISNQTWVCFGLYFYRTGSCRKIGEGRAVWEVRVVSRGRLCQREETIHDVPGFLCSQG
jgi:hypothetical protein